MSQSDKALRICTLTNTITSRIYPGSNWARYVCLATRYTARKTEFAIHVQAAFDFIYRPKLSISFPMTVGFYFEEQTFNIPGRTIGQSSGHESIDVDTFSRKQRGNQLMTQKPDEIWD
ncbi:hypothetical protein FVEG_09265 [Fusarium verticillioides 7600]|uniref:Uncharacterized protein n=1 Tax=Gibberella moniliformis (strain M3125 / FGSC 7600) TaxID=334819 RepID=W7MZT5_GIBM7|nr:hypothetical protein FVEG_09265 [Fusarium verticillioides 7600]EWG49902.1 hypothetical protein FVEG_09265 [Fusarium verticillioides 7600]